MILLNIRTPLLSTSRNPLLNLSKQRQISTNINPSACKPPYKVLLFGSDDFSCYTLKALHAEVPGLIEEITVVTPPNSKVGRNLKEAYIPPLRILAENLALKSIALTSSKCKDWSPPAPFDSPSPSHLLIAASFPHLIPTRILSLFPSENTLNVHPSLLPLLRGAAPIQWAVIKGEPITGVSVQLLSKGKLDQGSILGVKELKVEGRVKVKTLEHVLAREGANLLVDILKDLPTAQLNAIEQDPTKATQAPKILKENLARISWIEMGPVELERLQRGVEGHFPLQTFFPSHSPISEPEKLQLQLALLPPNYTFPSKLLLSGFLNSKPGTLYLEKSTNTLLIRAGKEEAGVIEIERLKGNGGKWVKGSQWFGNAIRGREGEMFLE